MNYEFEVHSFRNTEISIEDCIITDIIHNQSDITLVFEDGIMVYKDAEGWKRSGKASLTLCDCTLDDVMCWVFRSWAVFHRAWGIGTMPSFQSIVKQATKNEWKLKVDTFVFINDRLLARFRMKKGGKDIDNSVYEIDCNPTAIYCKYMI